MNHGLCLSATGALSTNEELGNKAPTSDGGRNISEGSTPNLSSESDTLSIIDGIISS